jgi:ParB-like chromosome segregation protein Spo0J
MIEYTIHPAANLFPMVEEGELAEIAADIKAHGLNESIKVCNGQIIDGRNRLEACRLADVEPVYETIEIDDPVAYVCSANIHRRHLTTRQRAAIAAELANLGRGGDRNPKGKNQYSEGREVKGSNDPLTNGTSIDEAAAMLNVSPKSVKRAKQTMREDPEAHEAAKAGVKPPKPSTPKPNAAIEPSAKDDGRTSTATERAREDGVQRSTSGGRNHTTRKIYEKVVGAESLMDGAPEDWAKKFREYKKKTDEQVQMRASLVSQSSLRDWIPMVKELGVQNEKLAAGYKGFMPKQEYDLIRGCLHPDRAVSTDRMDKAFKALTEYRDILIGTVKPVNTSSLPDTVEELLRRRK